MSSCTHYFTWLGLQYTEINCWTWDSGRFFLGILGRVLQLFCPNQLCYPCYPLSHWKISGTFQSGHSQISKATSGHQKGKTNLSHCHESVNIGELIINDWLEKSVNLLIFHLTCPLSCQWISWRCSVSTPPPRWTSRVLQFKFSPHVAKASPAQHSRLLPQPSQAVTYSMPNCELPHGPFNGSRADAQPALCRVDTVNNDRIESCSYC